MLGRYHWEGDRIEERKMAMWISQRKEYSQCKDSTEEVPCIRRRGSWVAWKRAEDNSQTLERDTGDVGSCLQRNTQ